MRQTVAPDHDEPSGDAHQDIRDGVRRLCAGFDGAYWRALDRERAYPADFVRALTEAGYLAILVPEAYGGAGLPLSAAAAALEEIHRSGGNGAACHAQMYTMGTLLRHGSEAQKRQWLPQIASGALRLQAFGVTEPASGTDTTRITTFARRNGDRYVVNGQKIWISRAEHSDLMLLLCRTAPREAGPRPTDGMSVLLIDLREAVGNGLTIRPIRTMLNHATTELFFDDLEVPAANLIGEEGRGFGYILDGMNAERILIASECLGDGRFFTDPRQRLRPPARGVRPADRPEPGGAVPHRPRSCGDRGGGPDGRQGRGPVRGGQALRDRGQHGQAPGVGGVLGGGRRLPADPRRLRLRRGFRHRAQVPRGAAISDSADLHQPDPVPRGHPRPGPAQVVLSMARPLDGLLVVSLEQAVAAPLATCKLPTPAPG